MRELSVLGVRSLTGETFFYPLCENQHRSGILRMTSVPATTGAQNQQISEQLCARLLERLDYVGVLALELFETEDGLLANEFAPRMHNSGHWTQNGAATDQFENHLRAIAGLPLGSCALLAPSAMVNLIGELPPSDKLFGHQMGQAHLYGKEGRAGRKVGHVNFTGEDAVDFARIFLRELE